MGEELSRDDFKNLLKNKKKPLLVKFTAEWCGPCKVIQHHLENFLNANKNANFDFLELDVDDNFDVFAFMKSKKMVTGIPALLFYDMETKEYPPKFSLLGADVKQFEDFCNNVLQSV